METASQEGSTTITSKARQATKKNSNNNCPDYTMKISKIPVANETTLQIKVLNPEEHNSAVNVVFQVRTV